MKKTIFFLTSALFLLLLAWMAVHENKVHAGHFIVLICLGILSVNLYHEKKKHLPRVVPPNSKRLKWQVDFYGLSGKGRVHMKFFEKETAEDYFHVISGTLFSQEGYTRLMPITPDRANNPIMVVFLRKVSLAKKLRYTARKRKDGRERIFLDNNHPVTSFIGESHTGSRIKVHNIWRQTLKRIKW